LGAYDQFDGLEEEEDIDKIFTTLYLYKHQALTPGAFFIF